MEQQELKSKIEAVLFTTARALKVKEIAEKIKNRTGDDIPQELASHDVAKAFFGVLQEVATSYSTGIPAQLTAHLDPVFNDNMYLAAQSLALGLSTLSALWFWATFYRLGTAAP